MTAACPKLPSRAASRRRFLLLAWSYAGLLILASVAVGGMAERHFSANLERSLERRLEGYAELFARRFDRETLTSLLEPASEEQDALMEYVFPVVRDSAAALGLRRVVIFRHDGKVAVDSLDAQRRGGVDHRLHSDRHEITRAVESGHPVSSVLYELPNESWGNGAARPRLAKTSYALAPAAANGAVPDAALIAAVELPADYAEQLAALRTAVALTTAAFAAFVLLTTAGANAWHARMSANLERSRKRAELADFSAAIAHEIKNPLAAIHTGTQLLARQVAPAQSPLAEKIQREVRLVDRIVRDFLAFARGAQRAPIRCDIESVIKGIREQLTPERAVILRVEGERERELLVDQAALIQALANLVNNAARAALEHAGDAARVTLDIRRAGGAIIFSVADNGPGVPADVRARLFEPFVSGSSDGTGLGLAIARRLAEDMGGSVRLTAAASPPRDLRPADPSAINTVFELRVPVKASKTMSKGDGLRP